MILFCLGTRPEWLKIKPILKHMREDYKIYFTGQHKDLMDEIQVNYSNDIDDLENRLDAVVTSCIKNFPDDSEITKVLVQGDTASAYACAVAAFHRGLKIYHLEAGLRTYDKQAPFPEESYRQMVSRIADVHLCPTEENRATLISERVHGNIEIVGNTVLDNITHLRHAPSYNDDILITLHRRENHEELPAWFEELNALAEKYPRYNFVMPAHPNPAVQEHLHLLTKVQVIDPVPHDEFMNMLAECRLIISDSGGIQEEASFLRKKVIVCRESTERQEGCGTGHLIMCKTPYRLKEVFRTTILNYIGGVSCPFGDGLSGKRVARILCK